MDGVIDDPVRAQRALDAVAACLDQVSVGGDVRWLSGDELRERQRVWARLGEMVAHGSMVTAREMLERRQWQADGARSAQHWITQQTGLPVKRAGVLVHLAHLYDRMPAAVAAHRAGTLTSAKLEQLSHCAALDADQFAIDEADLVARVEQATLGRAHAIVREWCDAYAHPCDAALAEQSRYESRTFSVRESYDDLYAIDGTAQREGAEIILTALDAVMGPPAADDSRTPAQRRYDALVDICNYALRSGDLPSNGGAPAQVTLVAQVEALDPAHTGPVSIDATWTGHWSSPTLDRLLCGNTSVSRVLLAKSVVVDVGEATHTIPTGLRRAIYARDRTCVWPGCDHYARWGDLHHVIAVNEGGATAQHNICALCSYHHRLLHEGGWTATLTIDNHGAHLDVHRPRPPPE